MSTTIVRLFVLCSLGALALVTGCDRTPGVRTSQSAGGPGNAPESERSPSPSPDR